MHSQHTLMRHKYIHQIHIDTTVNVETHLGKTSKVLFIWHEKYMAPFVYALNLQTLYYIFFFYIYGLLYPLILSSILSLNFLSFTLLTILTQPRSNHSSIQLYNFLTLQSDTDQVGIKQPTIYNAYAK